ncbi:MAG: FtsZ-binding protein FzlA [Hasllibacter sp.]
MITLYHYPLSPHCRKVRLSLAEKKLEVQLVAEPYWEKPAELMRRNPAGKVPVLKIDGEVLSESGAICEYLEETRPDPALMPKDPKERAEVRRLVGWFDDGFDREVTAKLVGERLNRKVFGQGYPDSRRVKEGSNRRRYHLEYLSWLLDRRRWLAGDVMTLADFAGAAHLSCLDYISDVPWQDFPLVHDWYAKVKSRPAFRPLLADAIPGSPPPRHYADLDF